MRLGANTNARDDRFPRLGPGVDPTQLALSPAEGFLLSRIDGTTPWTLLRAVGGLAPDEVDRCLERWAADGIIVVTSRDGRIVEAAPQAESARRAPPSNSEPPRFAPPSSSAASATRDGVDPSLEIPVEVQRRILHLETLLERPYHEILGVPADADRKALRKAYFALSKELHPDRFFRRNTGGFGKRLERIFGKIVEAYELLSDPTARAEIERSLAAAAGEAPAAAAPPPAAPEQAKAPRAPRRPHVFSLHARLLRDRKARAKRLFEAGMASYAAGRFGEAAGSMRLAIAFDPWNGIYKEHFVDVQRKAQEERAEKLVKEAENALELRDFATALRAFAEALEYRPHDAALLVRAARLAWATGGDLHRAKEWAMAAVELDGRDATSHRVLGQIYKAAGLAANARREFEAALALDPKDEEAQRELRSIGGRSLGLRWLGGKR